MRTNPWWFPGHDESGQYRSEQARRFFEAIKSPPEPSIRLKNMVERYGKYAFQKDKKD